MMHNLMIGQKFHTGIVSGYTGLSTRASSPNNIAAALARRSAMSIPHFHFFSIWPSLSSVDYSELARVFH